MREEERTAGQVGSGRTEVRSTSIRVSKLTRTVLLFGDLVALVLLMCLSPSTTVMLLGGLASTPVIRHFDFFRVRLRIRS